jgi:hypothetical protein
MCVCLLDHAAKNLGALPETNGCRQHTHRERDSTRLLSGKAFTIILTTN